MIRLRVCFLKKEVQEFGSRRSSGQIACKLSTDFRNHSELLELLNSSNDPALFLHLRDNPLQNARLENERASGCTVRYPGTLVRYSTPERKRSDRRRHGSRMRIRSAEPA